MLQDLPRDVQGEVRGIDDALDELEIVVHELVALFHDHDAVGVERDAALGIAVENALVLFSGDKEHGLVGNGSLRVHAHKRAGVLPVVILLFIESDAVFVGDIASAALPDRHHGVDGLVLGDHLIVIFRAAVVVLLAGLEALLMLHIHLDGPADIVGILPDESLELPYLEVGAVDLVLRVGLEVHDHIRADGLPLGLGDGVSVRAAALPLHGFIAAVLFRDHGDLVGDHERGIKAHAELADDGQILALCGIHAVLELI